jgi:hypothetical protein
MSMEGELAGETEAKEMVARDARGQKPCPGWKAPGWLGALEQYERTPWNPNADVIGLKLFIIIKKPKLCGFSLQANYTNRATAAWQRS